jgi:hypothetical protein
VIIKSQKTLEPLGQDTKMKNLQVVGNIKPLPATPRGGAIMIPRAILFTCLVLMAQAGSSEEAVPAATDHAQAVQQPGTGGMMVYVEPKTGQYLSEPAPNHLPLVLNPQMQNALSTSHSGLFEVANTVPGGGFKLDLQGRFQSPLIMTIDANGYAKTQHLQEKTKIESQTSATEAAQTGAQ